MFIILKSIQPRSMFYFPGVHYSHVYLVIEYIFTFQVFIIRKSSQTMSLALSVQNRLTDRANVDHYLIEASDFGMRLQGSAHFFHSIPSLIAYYIENLWVDFVSSFFFQFDFF